MSLNLFRLGRKARASADSSVTFNGRRYFNIDGTTLTKPTGLGDPRSNGAVVSCVQKIVSRSLEIPYISTDRSVQRVLDSPSWLKSVDSQMFWRRIYEEILYDGEAGIFRAASGGLRVGKVQEDATPEGSRVMRSFLTPALGDVDSETLRVDDADVCRLRWSESGVRAWEICRTDALAYAELMDDLYQEGKFARRVTQEIVYDEHFNDPDGLDEQLEEIYSKMRSGRKQQVPTLRRGVSFESKPIPESPPHAERLTEALAGVARVYGVPLQLLNTGLERHTVDEADAHLLRDSVLPLVRSVASGLTKIFGRPVEVDMRKVGLPSRTGIAGLVMQLSQSGVMTIDEVREQIGLPPIGDERGDEFPTTAGAGDREGDTSDDED